MILAFDVALLLAVSIAMGARNLYLGAVTFIIGLLIGFQTFRVRALLGSADETKPTLRKVKSAILAVILGLSLSPLLVEGTEHPFKELNPENLIPILSVILLFSAAMMAALVVERRKR